MNRSLWMVVSIVAIAAVLVWLRSASQSLEANVAPEMEDADRAALTLDDLRANLGGAVGSEAEIGVVPVGQSLGRGVFTLSLDESTQYPALLSRDLMARDTQIFGGDRVTTWGHIYTLNDSIRAEWVRLEAVAADQASAIPTTPSFILVDSLTFN